MSCPSPAELERLLLGLIPRLEAEPLEQHLEHCELCAATLHRLRAEDKLVSATRRAGLDPSTDGPEQELVDDLMDRLCLLPVVARRDEPTVASAVRGGSALESYDFLAPPETPGELGRLGPYRVLRVLGSGGMGVVFEAEDPQLRRAIALKVMKPALAASDSHRQRFVREARASAAIKHDHIVTIYQVGQDRGVPFLAMELLQGESLEERLQRQEPGSPLPVAEVLRIGREMAEGLAAAHEVGLIHRDIKPGNIWLESREQGAGSRNQESGVRSQKSGVIGQEREARVKILDFGLARGGDDPQVTQTGTIVGTPAYMAPEQARCEKVDRLCDLFSLGCVLYRLCTGVLPFQGADTMSTLTALALHTPPPPRQLNDAVPARLSDLVMKLLAKERTHRPASARAVIQALEAIENEHPAPPLPARPRWLWLAAATTGVLALALIFWRPTPEVRIHDRTGPGAVVDAAGVPVQAKKEAIPANRPDKARAAAEWVIQIGGTVVLPNEDGSGREIKVLNELPTSFRFFGIYLGGNARVTDVGLAHLEGLTELPKLYLTNTATSDAGLAHLRGVAGLEWLYLENTPITDGGLAYLKGLKRLQKLFLTNTRITDAGLAHLQGLTNLEGLVLGGAPIGDRGLEHLRNLTRIEGLYLNDTQVGDAGLAWLKTMTHLAHLDLRNTRVTDRGLEHLREAKSLRVLVLSGTQVTGAGLKNLEGLAGLQKLYLENTHVDDAGLEHLKVLTKLDTLHLVKAPVSQAAVQRLRLALPGCNIR